MDGKGREGNIEHSSDSAFCSVYVVYTDWQMLSSIRNSVLGYAFHVQLLYAENYIHIPTPTCTYVCMYVCTYAYL